MRCEWSNKITLIFYTGRLICEIGHSEVNATVLLKIISLHEC